MNIRPYIEADAHAWDSLVAESAQGNFLHSRRFLSYHGDRFRDASLLVFNDKDQLRGVFPAAVAHADPQQVVSHPGSTYGGLVHAGGVRADEVMSMFEAIAGWFARAGYRSLVYKSVPLHVQRSPDQADLYALWRMGASIARRDLWNTLDLAVPRKLSKGHRWSLKKASKIGVTAKREDNRLYPAFHALLSECLNDRHSALPVHAVDELAEIHARFPETIELWGAYDQYDNLIAGVWLFKLHEHCWHTQYIAATEPGRELFATDLLLETIISAAQQAGIRYFSFGASTYDGGRELNAGLFGFKAGFGHGAVIHDFYQMEFKA